MLFSPLSLISLFSGLIYPLAFAPYEYRSLVFVSLAGFIYSLYQSKSAKQSLLLGWLFGFGVFATGLYWIYNALSIYGEANPIIAFLMTVLAASVFGLLFSLFSFLSYKLKKYTNGIQWFLFIPLFWGGFECFRSWFLTGLPWLLSGSSQIDGILSGWLPIVGVFGTGVITMFIVACALVFLLPVISTIGKNLNFFIKTPLTSVRDDKNQIKIMALLIVVFALSFLLKDIQWTQSTKGSLKVALVQGNIEQTLKFQPGMLQKALNNYMRLSTQHLDADVIIWPETAIPTFFSRVKQWFEPQLDIFKQSNTQLLTGIFTKDKLDKTRYYNSFVDLTKPYQKYDKEHLVPFGEYMPFRSWFEFLAQYIQIPMSDIQAGKSKQKLMQIGDYKALISICFEDAYSELFISEEEPDFYINISNDAWYGDSSAPWQHQEIARSRVAEYQKPMLRVTNNGVTAVMNAQAKITAQSPQFKEFIVTGEITPSKGNTPFARWQNKPLFLLLLLLVVYLLTKKQGFDKKG